MEQAHDQVQVLTTSFTKQSVTCEIHLAHVPTKRLVDTSSSVSILPKDVYRRHFHSYKLECLNTTLLDYSGKDIPVLGKFDAPVQFAQRRSTCTFHVVRTGVAVMGLNAFCALDIQLNFAPPTGGQVATVSARNLPEITQDFPHLFSEGLGHAKGFVHKVKTKDSVAPFQQKLPRLPFAVREKVSEELVKLEHSGVIERIDASEWVSPIVVARKKNGQIRLCVGLCKPNTAIVLDSHPLPCPDKLFHQLSGAHIFSKLDLSLAYHQLDLAEESRDLTAFVAHECLFRFTRVCFGLASAAPAFQK